MKVRLTKQNISDNEMAKALAGIATQEGVSHEVHELLGQLVKADRKTVEDIIPERYMRYIGDRLVSEFNALVRSLIDNMEIWVLSQSDSKKTFLKSLRKAEDELPLLTQAQMDELSALIEYHFRTAIGIGYTVSDAQKKQWAKMGIKDPNVHLDEWIKNAYVAGRLAEILNNDMSYADMMKLAKKLPMSRQDKLVLEMSKQNSAKYIKGYAQKLGGLATDVALDQHKLSINAVIQSYFKGELDREIHPESGFSPDEESVIRKVTSWRELASELRNRFKQTDLVRDWERVAFTEMRYATNLGRLMNIQHEGGGDPEDIEVFYHVLPTACSSCKKLYLNPDGTPKIFKLSEILQNVEDTGGLNVGRKASAIGQPDGWLPNAVVHPNCHCYPVRKIGGYKYAEFQ
jgi:hypothetical protein